MGATGLISETWSRIPQLTCSVRKERYFQCAHLLNRVALAHHDDLRCAPYCDSGLDPPLALYLPRLCLRTLKRLFGLVPPCSPNCPERVSEAFFSKDSIIWWCISHHWSVRKRESERCAVDGIEAGGKIRRLGGWGKDRDEWLRAVRVMVDGHRQ